MVINVSGSLPDIIMLTLCSYHGGTGDPMKSHEEVLSLQPCSQLNVLTTFPLSGGCSESLDAFRLVFIQ